MRQVTIEIEHHACEDSFHTRYRSEKYHQLANSLQNSLADRFGTEDISYRVDVNPGPNGKGWSPYFNTKGYYVQAGGKDGPKKVAYPRLGAFEVTLQCSRDFAPASCVPTDRKVIIWSKLRTRLWPTPQRLVDDLVKLLVASREGDSSPVDARDLLDNIMRRGCPPEDDGKSETGRASSSRPPQMPRPTTAITAAPARTQAQSRPASAPRSRGAPPPRRLPALEAAPKLRPASASQSRSADIKDDVVKVYRSLIEEPTVAEEPVATPVATPKAVLEKTTSSAIRPVVDGTDVVNATATGVVASGNADANKSDSMQAALAQPLAATVSIPEADTKVKADKQVPVALQRDSTATKLVDDTYDDAFEDAGPSPAHASAAKPSSSTPVAETSSKKQPETLQNVQNNDADDTYDEGFEGEDESPAKPSESDSAADINATKTSLQEATTEAKAALSKTASVGDKGDTLRGTCIPKLEIAIKAAEAFTAGGSARKAIAAVSLDADLNSAREVLGRLTAVQTAKTLLQKAVSQGRKALKDQSGEAASADDLTEVLKQVQSSGKYLALELEEAVTLHGNLVDATAARNAAPKEAPVDEADTNDYDADFEASEDHEKVPEEATGNAEKAATSATVSTAASEKGTSSAGTPVSVAAVKSEIEPPIKNEALLKHEAAMNGVDSDDEQHVEPETAKPSGPLPVGNRQPEKAIKPDDGDEFDDDFADEPSAPQVDVPSANKDNAPEPEDGSEFDDDFEQTGEPSAPHVDAKPDAPVSVGGLGTNDVIEDASASYDDFEEESKADESRRELSASKPSKSADSGSPVAGATGASALVGNKSKNSDLDDYDEEFDTEDKTEIESPASRSKPTAEAVVAEDSEIDDGEQSEADVLPNASPSRQPEISNVPDSEEESIDVAPAKKPVLKQEEMSQESCGPVLGGPAAKFGSTPPFGTTPPGRGGPAEAFDAGEYSDDFED